MPRKPKAKKKHPLHLDFVTALTVDECLDVLIDEVPNFTGYGTQQVGFDDEGWFWVVRTVRGSPPSYFEGQLTPVAAGTRIKGQIAADTLARIQRRIRLLRGAQLIAFGLYTVIVFAFTVNSPADAGLRAVFRYLTLFGVFSFGAVVPMLRRGPEQVVNWLHKYLWYAPELESLALGDNHELEATSEAETLRPAVETEQRDQAHST